MQTDSAQLERHRLRDSCSLPTVVSVVWRFPRGPVGPYRARPQPLPVHQRDGVLRLHLLGEAHEAVAFRLQRLRVPHHSAVAERGGSVIG